MNLSRAPTSSGRERLALDATPRGGQRNRGLSPSSPHRHHPLRHVRPCREDACGDCSPENPEQRTALETGSASRPAQVSLSPRRALNSTHTLHSLTPHSTLAQTARDDRARPDVIVTEVSTGWEGSPGYGVAGRHRSGGCHCCLGRGRAR